MVLNDSPPPAPAPQTPGRWWLSGALLVLTLLVVGVAAGLISTGGPVRDGGPVGGPSPTGEPTPAPTESSPTAGEPPPQGSDPGGSIPTELVGTWCDPLSQTSLSLFARGEFLLRWTEIVQGDARVRGDVLVLQPENGLDVVRVPFTLEHDGASGNALILNGITYVKGDC
jgi:hypothetical protein